MTRKSRRVVHTDITETWPTHCGQLRIHEGKIVSRYRRLAKRRVEFRAWARGLGLTALHIGRAVRLWGRG